MLITGAEAMETALAFLGSALVGDLTRKVAGTGLLDTVEVDLHEIGKLLLGTMLIANGYRVIGVEKAASEFIDITKDLGQGTAFRLIDAPA